MLDLLARAESFGSKPAVSSPEGEYGYDDLAAATRGAAAALLGDRNGLAGARVGLMVDPGFRYVTAQWGTWAAGGVSVPLAVSHPAPELEYVVDDASITQIVATDAYRDVLAPIAAARGIPVLDAATLHTADPERELPPVRLTDRCLILYTSGTTGRPKGVVWRHSNLLAQVESLTEAWRWTGSDRALLVLPLHHVHGLVNVVTSGLANGATVEMLPRFDVDETWRRLGSGEVTVFMAVPTIYRRLIDRWEQESAGEQRSKREALEGMRLMISGSAALPVPTLEKWRAITGHTLLERYGMTEIGMALSNPYDGTRRPGTVGTPLPTVEVRLVDEDGTVLREGVQGEIEVRGPSVFSEYWGRPEDTAEAFHDGWFRTGDQAVVDGGVYRILGRRSVDIIKSGGEKISALEVEDVLRTHPAVDDCAVVGIPDAEWGERVVAAVVAAGALDPAELRGFARERLAPYKVPRRVVIVAELPRNVLGKVMKPELKQLPELSTGPDL